MAKSSNESYQEGWNDCLQFVEKSYIKKDEIDILLDNLNEHKIIFNYLLDHFRKNKNISGRNFRDESSKQSNLEDILKKIETNCINLITKDSKNGK
jgi:hypothetical protein